MQQFTNTSLAPASSLYVNGFQLTWVSTSTFTINSGICRDITNTYDIASSNPLTVSTATTGVNALDTGTIANNSWYAIYIVFDPTYNNVTAAVISLSSTAPAMPAVNGVVYGAIRRIGWVRTNSSAQIISFYQSGNASSRFYEYATPISILSAGVSSGSFTSLNCSAGMPPQTTPMYLEANYTPAVITNVASIKPHASAGAYGSCPVNLQGSVATIINKFTGFKILPLILTGNATVDYQTAASDSLSLTVTGFEDAI